MDNFQVYQENKVESGTMWILFLLLGWSYGSMNEMAKQIFFYLTLGGLGFWTIYRLLTLNKAIKKYNRHVAIVSGLSADEMTKLGLY